jgi:hypothetical protein
MELERLVDGELEQDEYRDLLLRIEQSPDGWRRCSLAFLQQQAIATSLKSVHEDWFMLATHELMADPRPGVCAPTRVPSSAAASRSRWSATLCLPPLLTAALFGLLAGAALMAWRPWNVPHFAAGLLQQRAGVEPRPPLVHASQDELSGDRPDRMVTAGQGDDMSAPTMYLRFARTTSDGNVEMPLYPLNLHVPRPQWLVDSAVPRDLDRVLRQSGRSVRRRWQYLPVRLSDGRDAVIPIEQVELRPVMAEFVP